MPTIQERLDKAQQASVALYLKRTQIEEQRQQIASIAMGVDRELVKLDGQIALLLDLAKEANG